MDFEQNELKEIWARSDEYFQFRYEEYRTFGGRLKNGVNLTIYHRWKWLRPFTATVNYLVSRTMIF